MQGANYTGFLHDFNDHSAGIPVSKEKFEKSSKIQTGFPTQKVS
jgi:hypothetical protein